MFPADPLCKFKYKFGHFHHCCRCLIGCYAMYCSPCAFYDMAEDMEPGTGVRGPHQDFFEVDQDMLSICFFFAIIVIFWSLASKHHPCPCDHHPRCSGDAPCPCHQVSKVLRWCTWFSGSSSLWLLSSCSEVRRGRRVALRFAFPNCSIARAKPVANINAALLRHTTRLWQC